MPTLSNKYIVLHVVSDCTNTNNKAPPHRTNSIAHIIEKQRMDTENMKREDLNLDWCLLVELELNHLQGANHFQSKSWITFQKLWFTLELWNYFSAKLTGVIQVMHSFWKVIHEIILKWFAPWPRSDNCFRKWK